jgi:hypothetical protein
MALAVLPNGDLVAGGQISSTTGPRISNIARWDGSQWLPLGEGLNDRVEAIALLPNGDLIAGGWFTMAGNVPASHIARWDGKEWSPLGAGTNGQTVYALAVLPNGELAVGGRFTTAGGLRAGNFARWSENPSPVVAIDPQAETVEVGTTAILSSTAAGGYHNVSYAWLRNGVPVADGPGGASAGGGIVSGASGFLSSPTRGEPATLTIDGVAPSDTGEYVIVFTNACGSVTSRSAALMVTGGCAGDFNADGALDSQDLFAFLAAFFAQSLAADFDQDGEVNAQDFFAFLAAVFSGC